MGADLLEVRTMQNSSAPFKIAIIGFGAVGQGVARVVQNVPQLEVVAIADSKGVALTPDLEDVLARKRAGKSIANSNLTALDVIRTVDNDVVVEVTPTNIDDGEPGLTHFREALKNKRNVVTSNKGPLVAAFGELTKLARTQGVALRYEATVGGAMPIINLIRDTLAGTQVLGIRGVLNGTCNYILTRMADEALEYDQVLSEAQDMGIAEADPTYDVAGIDTACKVVILANAFFNRQVTFADVNVTGIDRITARRTATCAAERICSKTHWRRSRANGLSKVDTVGTCLLYTSPSPRDGLLSRMP